MHLPIISPFNKGAWLKKKDNNTNYEWFTINNITATKQFSQTTNRPNENSQIKPVL